MQSKLDSTPLNLYAQRILSEGVTFSKLNDAAQYYGMCKIMGYATCGNYSGMVLAKQFAENMTCHQDIY